MRKKKEFFKLYILLSYIYLYVIVTMVTVQNC
jgi:hypothetical protein